MQIIENASLKNFNSFGFDVSARWFCQYNSADDINLIINKLGHLSDKKILILGNGCNIVFINNFDGLIIHPTNSYIKIVGESDDYCYVESGAGTTWDEFVEWAVNNNLGGIENLSLIPSSVGAAPVQNIGAYGCEAKDSIEKVNIVKLEDGLSSTLTNSDCHFGYRDSIFKHELKDKYLVDSVIFRLSKKPTFTTHYGSLNSEIEKLGKPTLKTVRQAVINIRDSKLPDPKLIGNVGSFFKNPTIDAKTASTLILQYPEMVHYPTENGKIKIAAGWLIDKCGLKGYVNKAGNAGVHKNQALVLVNLGGATGQDIIEVAEYVQDTVFNEFGIKIEPEAIIINN